jgi:signal transduction histidine kinase
MKGFCKDFGDKHKVEIEFSNEGIPSGVPPEISLCLFRIMQEGLQNALKHSGVKFFEVKLHGSPAEIRLTVRDSGVGFEPELTKDTGTYEHAGTSSTGEGHDFNYIEAAVWH